MKIVFDTNIVLDILTGREPFADASTEAMAIAVRKRSLVAITANTVTDLYFLLRKLLPNRNSVKTELEKLVRSVDVLDTTRDICLLAFKSLVADFEDAVLAESALRWNADCIVTRNIRDFAASPVEAILPDELLRRL